VGVTIAVVLAAGRGDRLGGVAKALLRCGGRTFLAAIARTCAAAGVDRLVVVVGPPFAGRVAAEAARLGAAVATNPAPARGMASSVAVGFAALLDPAGPAAEARADVALLWPVDHPLVTAATVAALVAEVAGGDLDVVAPRAVGRGGHPVAIGRAVWPSLARAADLPRGARDVLGDPRWRRRDQDVDDRGVVQDIDHPDQLSGLRDQDASSARRRGIR
jgi:molybdenum cofactor cytidylyltransferase